jgi:hypothetical protein
MLLFYCAVIIVGGDEPDWMEIQYGDIGDGVSSVTRRRQAAGRQAHAPSIIHRKTRWQAWIQAGR